MSVTVPLSRLHRATSEVAALVADQDVILDRRDAEDLYLSTRERHERSASAARITTDVLAEIARTRPDLAGEAMVATLPWMAWLPSEDKVECLGELLEQLRAGAQTGELRPFHAALEAWKSTAVIYSDPAVLAGLQRASDSAELAAADSDVTFPTSAEAT